MKNVILRKLSLMHYRFMYAIVFCFLTLFLFLIVIYKFRSDNGGNYGIEIIGGVIVFLINLSFLYRLKSDINSGMSAKLNLAENEIKYSHLIENAGIIMYTATLNGRLTFASSKAFQLTGYSIKELTGMHFSDFIDEEWLESVTEKYKNQIKNDLHETQIEFCIRTKFGDKKWVEQSAVLIKENNINVGFQCIIKDISDTKEMEEVLRKYELELVQNQERLQSILDNATSLIYIKDLTGRYQLTNKQFKETLNVTDEMVIGKTDFDFSKAEEAERFKKTDDLVLITGKPVDSEETIEISGEKRNLLIVKFPLIDAQNKVYGISGIATDITDRVIQREELIQAKKIAEDAKRLQEQFLAYMSHEIRTPMNGIQGMTDLLLETKLNDEQKDFARTIKRSTDNLIVIINDILDFSKIKAGKLTIEKIDFELNEVVENIKCIFKERIEEKSLQFKIEIDRDVPATLNGDPYRLNQILVNLIGNAIKFTPDGGIHFKISIKKKTDSEIILDFSISDSGIGIETEKINEIFESFTQASVETSRKYGGTGLGLAITKQLLELQKGEISVESKINIGTTFHFSIPYNYSKSNKQLFFRNKDFVNHHSLLEGTRILVAEDNEVNQKVILQVLKKMGGSVDIANNGLEAVSFLKKSTDYDLIIMDLQMPEMDGYAATKYIRNVMNLSIPIMAMTASALKGEKAKCLKIGMNDYLTKPFNFSFLYERINLLLNDESAAHSIQITEKKENNKLYDLSLLEEMDDNEYLSEILTIFLNKTPEELKELEKACELNQFEAIYKAAHKLKSSAGIIKAETLLNILIKIEEYAMAKKRDEIVNLIKKAQGEFVKMESPIKEHIKNIQEIQNVNS